MGYSAFNQICIIRILQTRAIPPCNGLLTLSGFEYIYMMSFAATLPVVFKYSVDRYVCRSNYRHSPVSIAVDSNEGEPKRQHVHPWYIHTEYIAGCVP